MSSTFINTIPGTIREVFEAYATSDAPDLFSFLEQTVSTDDARTILDMVDGIRRADQALRESGLPARTWLGEELDTLVPTLSDVALGGDLRGFEPHEIGSRIVELGLTGVGEASGVGDAVAAGVGVVAEAGIPLVTEFFNGELGGAVEREVVAVASAGVVKVARAVGVDARVEAITGAVDLGLRVAKVAFLGEQGLLDEDAVFREVENRVASVARAGADYLVDRMPDATAAVGAFIGGVLGNPILGQTVGRTIGELAAPVIRPIARQGADRVARSAVQWGRKAVKTAATKLKSFLFG